MRLPIVVSSAILLCGAAPAGALVIDDFTTGPFNFQASIGGAVASQVCTCLGGAREISLQSGNASLDAAVQLLKPPGEAANVMPDGGGHLAFTYAGFAPPVDLTQGIAGGVLDVWFNAFAPGAAVRVTIEDDTGASQTQSQLPVLPILPANVGFALASFGSVDLVHVTRIEVVIDAPDVGDYHVREIGLPSPDLVQSGFEIGVASLAGGPYPSEPITFDACAPALGGACSPTLHVELSLSEVTGGMGSLPAQVDATLLPTTEGARISFGSEVMGVQPEPFHVVYRLAYPANGTTPVDGIPCSTGARDRTTSR
jgi:hypothetical protein